MPTAYGFVETKGFIGVIEATDAMSKAANVEYARRADIGAGMVTTICRGDVGAVRSAVTAGKQRAEEVGELYTSHVIPNLHNQVIERILGAGKCGSIEAGRRALGMIETIGYTPMIEAADAALKAANVQLANHFWIGRGYALVLFRGDVAACQSAAEAGHAGAEQLGKVIGSHVIPAPHATLPNVFAIGPETEKTKATADQDGALGFVETRGLLGLIEATDAAVKAARVIPLSWQRLGSARVTFVVQGDVAAVKSAVAAGETAAKRVGEHLASLVIPRPHAAAVQFQEAGRQ